MTRALWLADTKPPKELNLNGKQATVLAIKNPVLKQRLLPDIPEVMTIKAAMDWAELVRRVATGCGANTVLIDPTLALEPLLLTLQHTLRPYRVTLRPIE